MAKAKATRWEHSRLRQRVPLPSVSDGSSDSDGGACGGGGAPLYPDGRPETAKPAHNRAASKISDSTREQKTANHAAAFTANGQLSDDVASYAASVYNRNPILIVPGAQNVPLSAMPGQVNFQLTPPLNRNGFAQMVPGTDSRQAANGLSPPAGPSPGSSHGSSLSPGSMNGTAHNADQNFLNRPPIGLYTSPRRPTVTPMSSAGDSAGSLQQNFTKEEGREFLMQFLYAKAGKASPPKKAGESKIVQPPPGLGFARPRDVGQGQQVFAGGNLGLDGVDQPHMATQARPIYQNGSNLGNGQHVFNQNMADYSTTTPIDPRQLPQNQSDPAGNQITNMPAHAAGLIVRNQQPLGQLATHVGGGSADRLSPLEFTPVPDELRLRRSARLNQLTGTNGKPDLQALLDPENLPFVEAWGLVEESCTGVVCLTNIPYDVTRAEVLAFLGRSAKIPNDNNEPVHIIMDRTTSKTNDCYVEFNTLQDAVNAVSKHRMAIDNGRHPRMGRRSVDEHTPYQFTTNSAWPWENFKGFVTKEEMISLCKHAECPNHSPFAMNCPERVYECLISTLKKLPWYVADHITIKERGYVYATTEKMIYILKARIQKGDHPTRLTDQLLERLANAAMSCAGFSVMQKDNIACIVDMEEYKLRDFNMPRFADRWTHLHGLSVKPGVPLDVVEYYIALIREDTNRIVDRLGIQRKRELKRQQAKTSDYWGFFWKEIAFPPVGNAFDSLTLADLVALEWVAIENCLRRAVEGGEIPASFSG
ncbi:hypothetical protein F5Y05DRAFT_423877 [Hypoxylon sp. FL0543]|nr:hypothetical protein F5Y05DRAFT_423877 [Hypoxylon sp. FL0543]